MKKLLTFLKGKVDDVNTGKERGCWHLVYEDTGKRTYDNTRNRTYWKVFDTKREANKFIREEGIENDKRW